MRGLHNRLRLQEGGIRTPAHPRKRYLDPKRGLGEVKLEELALHPVFTPPRAPPLPPLLRNSSITRA